jgi:catechol 2,3-dioxygenase-like lactoylglutathione lyase family enzyme
VIQHVTREIPPAQLDACLRFYGLLGFEPVSVPPGIAGRALWLQNGPTQLHLMPREDARPQTGHVGVVIERYDDTVAQLRRDGHLVDPRREHWGAPRAYVRDPAGNLVELMAWPPGAHGPAAGEPETESE